MKQDHYAIVLPVAGALTTLIAEAKKINDVAVIKSLVQRIGAGFPSIDKIKMMNNDAYELMAVAQISTNKRFIASVNVGRQS